MHSLQARAQERAALLMAGHYDALVQTYALPLALYIEGEPGVVTTRDEARRFLCRLHRALRAENIVRLEAQVIAQDLPRDGRKRCWIDHWGITACGQRRLVLQFVCYNRESRGSLRIEMVEFLRLDVPLGLAA